MTLLNRIVKLLANVTMVVCALLMIFSLGALTADIFLRVFMRSSITGVHELVTITFTSVFLLGTGVLYVRNEDVMLSFLVGKLPQALQQATAVLTFLGLSITLWIVAWQTAKLIWAQRMLTTPALGLPRWLETGPMCFAAFLVALGAMLHALNAAQSLRAGTPNDIGTGVGKSDAL